MLKQLFNKFDKFDKDGGRALDREEICALAHKLTPDAATHDMDHGGEGDVDVVEFCVAAKQGEV